MNQWKIILATLVIFCTGFFAGVLFPKGPRSVPGNPATSSQAGLPLPNERRIEALRRFTHDMDLSEEQRGKIESHIQESQERTRLLWDLVGPEVQEEFKRLRSEVVSELSNEQKRKFEERSKKYRRERSARPEGRELPPSIPIPQPPPSADKPVPPGQPF